MRRRLKRSLGHKLFLLKVDRRNWRFLVSKPFSRGNKTAATSGSEKSSSVPWTALIIGGDIDAELAAQKARIFGRIFQKNVLVVTDAGTASDLSGRYDDGQFRILMSDGDSMA